ncbi:MAG: hypothetical protein ACK443_11015 [Methylococcaceae bacterium]
MIADRDAQIASLSQAYQLAVDSLTEVEAHRNQQAEENAELSERVGVLQAELEARDAEITEIHQRQNRINEEMIKAEAQIDLIKDVFLRAPGL